MKTIDAIYENGVFRPLELVDLPERTSARVQVGVEEDFDERKRRAQEEIYRILGERYNSGDPYGAERHNEHQP